jgi:hypothetical protein
LSEIVLLKVYYDLKLFLSVLPHTVGLHDMVRVHVDTSFILHVQRLRSTRTRAHAARMALLASKKVRQWPHRSITCTISIGFFSFSFLQRYDSVDRLGRWMELRDINTIFIYFEIDINTMLVSQVSIDTHLHLEQAGHL